MRKAWRRSIWFTLVLLASLTMVITCTDSLTGNYAITNVNIIPMTGEGLIQGATVVVKGGLIDAIVDADEATISDSSVVIDGTGRYLIPGLADMHVHFGPPTDGVLFVANGVTLVRNMSGLPIMLFSKATYANGFLLGPELWTAGQVLDGDPPAWENWPPKVVTTPEEGRLAVLDTIAAGYDGVKVFEHLSLEVFQAIMETANEYNFPVWAHLGDQEIFPEAVSLIDAANAGLHSAEHLIGYSSLPDLNEQIAVTIENEMWNCPTLFLMDTMSQLTQLRLDSSGVVGLEYVSPLIKAAWDKKKGLPLEMGPLFSIASSLYQAGGRLLVGTAANGPYVVPGFSIHEELRLLVEEVGLPPCDVLRMATCNAAQFLGISDRLGTIEEGKEADLVLLTANPLEDINNTKSRVGVMVDGRWYTNEELIHLLR